jgi:hypothetical protein
MTSSAGLPPDVAASWKGGGHFCDLCRLFLLPVPITSLLPYAQRPGVCGPPLDSGELLQLDAAIPAAIRGIGTIPKCNWALALLG